MSSQPLICDGCGQAADTDHIARRLQRLEHMTRYRPIHVQAMFLGAASPLADGDYLYSAANAFSGEGLSLLLALGMNPAAKSMETVWADFQRRGYLLTHILECPNEPGEKAVVADKISQALEQRMGTILVRIRRSLKPKKLVLLGRELDPFVVEFSRSLPDSELVTDQGGRAFRLQELEPGRLAAALSSTLTSTL